MLHSYDDNSFRVVIEHWSIALDEDIGVLRIQFVSPLKGIVGLPVTVLDFDRNIVVVNDIEYGISISTMKSDVPRRLKEFSELRGGFTSIVIGYPPKFKFWQRVRNFLLCR